MKKLHILHLGIGNVGKEVQEQIQKQNKYVQKEFGVALHIAYSFHSKNSEKEIQEAIDNIPNPFVLVDTTASDQTVPYIIKALRRGGFAVLANKKPLAMSQVIFDKLHRVGKQRLFYECVVGAGLPVICPLKDFIATGDSILEIQGCFSGTLGFIFSQHDQGINFSQAVKDAKEKGFTEPDPRDDLSGKDVARKALILARLMGKKIELQDIQLEGLYPQSMQELSVEEFLIQCNQLDNRYKKMVQNAKMKDQVIRFVAKVSKNTCSVGLMLVEKDSDIGNLQGPDNIIVIKTERYFDNPLVIKGPGAGIAVTAGGVFSDILSIARIVRGGES